MAADDTTTPDLALRRRAGSSDAGMPFERFHERDRDRLVRLLALDLGDVALAAEAVDTAMARAWQRWDRLDHQPDAGAWVHRVARNWATSWFRRRRFVSRGPVPDVATTDPDPVEPGPLRAALDGLSSDHRAVVVLRMHAELSTTATAAAPDIPEGTVKSRLSRALDQLRTALEDQR